ncbi:cytochrome P450 [Nostoc sp. ChiSLP03a]|uniref:cytochrome P450 n=1 Tax=Nostoc sp. ChiSLP03a TaxID=3075380 RepID=UPI002AD225EC|nr:cytochrome P450 [Nostoc sp. ChiSLP03a]MDZ8214370.1 cytochrome P450 [Nostoc sp. ChiSLP03a]
MTQLKPAQEMPGSFGLPILGETLRLFATQGWGLAKNYERYGPVFKTSILGKKYAVLVGVEANRLILQEKADYVSSYLGWKVAMEHIFGRPMMLQDGEEHRRTRRLMAPAFHSKAIANYFDIMQTEVNKCLENWVQNSPISIKNEFNQLALRIGIRLLLGVRLQSEVEQVEQLYNTLTQGALALLRLDIPFTKYGRSQNARRQLKAFLEKIISERKLQGNLEESCDVLGLFLAALDEDGNALAQSQIVDELIHLLNAAHFTTATSLTWAMVELAARPQWRDRLRQELREVVKDEPLNLGHLKQLNQMTYFFKEIERLYNPAGVVLFRGVVKEIEYAGYRIPPGWVVIVAQGLTHRMSEIYTNPESFDPERFAPPREEDKKDSFALIGFGGGEHTCIGIEFAKMEMKIFLATLLQRYDWKVTPEYQPNNYYQLPFQVEGKLQAQVTSLCSEFKIQN